MRPGWVEGRAWARDRWPDDTAAIQQETARSTGAALVVAEAMRQHDRLGYSLGHDRRHTPPEWAALLLLRVARLATPTGWDGAPSTEESVEYLAEVGAMCARAIDALTAGGPE